jgi:RNA polymerase sigma-70 factor (ECF subfamily)
LIEASQTTWNDLFVLHTEDSWNSVFRFSLSLCKNESEAEDLTQQTLLKGLQAFPSFLKNNYSAETLRDAADAAQRQGFPEFQAHLLNWLLKICKNAFLDSRSRASRRYSHMSIEEWGEEHEASQSLNGHEQAHEPEMKTAIARSSLADDEQRFFEQALDDGWKERFDTLNAKQRSIVFLAAEDYSYKEIAHLLEIPIGTVMSTLSRSLSKLKNQAKK